MVSEFYFTLTDLESFIQLPRSSEELTPGTVILLIGVLCAKLSSTLSHTIKMCGSIEFVFLLSFDNRHHALTVSHIQYLQLMSRNIVVFFVFFFFKLKMQHHAQRLHGTCTGLEFSMGLCLQVYQPFHRASTLSLVPYHAAVEESGRKCLHTRAVLGCYPESEVLAVTECRFTAT